MYFQVFATACNLQGTEISIMPDPFPTFDQHFLPVILSSPPALGAARALNFSPTSAISCELLATTVHNLAHETNVSMESVVLDVKMTKSLQFEESLRRNDRQVVAKDRERAECGQCANFGGQGCFQVPKGATRRGGQVMRLAKKTFFVRNPSNHWRTKTHRPVGHSPTTLTR